MKVKLDENLPRRLASALAKLGHDIDTVESEGLTGRPDEDVWMAARREQRFLITQDLDFSDIRLFQPGTHPGLLLVRLRDPNAVALSESVLTVVRMEGLDSLVGCLAVLTNRKLRIKRP